MQAAIIAMQAMADDDQGVQMAEAMHAKAIAEALPGIDITPCLICGHDSPLALMPLAVPRLCIRQGSLGGLFRLWQWQRKHPDILAIAVGGQSLKTGRWLIRMGKTGRRQSFAAFFLTPPDKLAAKLLDKFQFCICGSSFIKQNIESLRLKKMPALLEAAPGIDLEEYQYPATPFEPGGHFVFGMGGSLMEDSGALLLVRAMSALWQQEDVPPWEARMFGGGPRFEEVMDEAAKLGVLSRLSILNEQPLGEASRHCHVWIAPGTRADELPQVLWAGFASGLPLIASRSDLHKERLCGEDDATAEIQLDNPQKMAKVMLQMLRDAKWREEFAEAGAAMRPKISLQGMAERVLALVSANFVRPVIEEKPEVAKQEAAKQEKEKKEAAHETEAQKEAEETPPPASGK